MSATPDPRRTRVLLIGPLPSSGSPIGGTAVSFAELTARCRASDALVVDVVNTSRALGGPHPLGRRCADVRALARVLRETARRSRAADVVFFNASSGAMLGAGPLVWAIARGRGKPLAVRLFGGCFDEFFDASSRFTRALAERTVLASPLVLLQTRSLCRRFAHVPGVRWLPTTRGFVARGSRPSPRCRRFLFLAQLRPEKGLAETLAAIDRAPAGCTLTVYGPPMPGLDVAILEGRPRVTYGGVLPPERVQDVLEQHDALVFPTYHTGEGLPGVVIEAMQCGLPVIASRWRTVPEVVEHELSGLLVEPRSVSDLESAMTRLARDHVLFRTLCVGARARGAVFQAAPWQERVERWLHEVAAGRRPHRDGDLADHAAATALGPGLEEPASPFPSPVVRDAAREARS